MAFKKKTWKDRLVEFAGRRTLKRISGSADSQMVVDVSRNEGTVSQAGDAFSAANMNDLEQRIADEFSSINNNLGGCQLTQEGEDFYIVGADSVRKKLGSATIKSQTLSSGRVGSSGYTHTFVFDKLSKVSGITSVSARGYSTPSPNQDNNCYVSISGNKVTLRLAVGYSYYEYTCAAFEVIG